MPIVEGAMAADVAAQWASDRDAPLVGRDIDTYHVIPLLGAGGMGVVMDLADDFSLGRRVALKVLPQQFGDPPPRRLRRFTDEARAASALNHPNILTVLRIGEFDRVALNIATELIDGENVRARIARGPVPAVEALAIAKQVAAALDARQCRHRPPRHQAGQPDDPA